MISCHIGSPISGDCNQLVIPKITNYETEDLLESLEHVFTGVFVLKWNRQNVKITQYTLVDGSNMNV